MLPAANLLGAIRAKNGSAPLLGLLAQLGSGSGPPPPPLRVSGPTPPLCRGFAIESGGLRKQICLERRAFLQILRKDCFIRICAIDLPSDGPTLRFLFFHHTLRFYPSRSRKVLFPQGIMLLPTLSASFISLDLLVHSIYFH